MQTCARKLIMMTDGPPLPPDPSAAPFDPTLGAPAAPPAYPNLGAPAAPPAYPNLGAPAAPPAYPPMGAPTGPPWQYSQSPYGPPAWGPPARPRVDGFAITTFVTGLFGVILFSVGFGIASIRRIRRGERRGMGLTVAGLVLSGVWIAVVVAIIAFTAGRQPVRNSDNGTVTHQGQLSPTALHVGDCVRVPRELTGPVKSLTVVPCSQQHNGQVFATIQATQIAYPGTTALTQQGLSDCEQAYPAFLGTDQTPLHVVAFVPEQTGWNNGDRGEHCLLVDRDKDITGDIRDDH
jgi:hypothetical protein